MHARELVEFGGWLAIHSRSLLLVEPWPLQPGIARYWAASKCRLQRWTQSFKNHVARTEQVSTDRRKQLWLGLSPMIEEILLSELLARVWAGVGCLYDRRHGRSEMEPVVRSVLAGQQEARRQALSLMVHGSGFSVEQAVMLNRLRRRAERWTDTLLGHLGDTTVAREFAFDRTRQRLPGQLAVSSTFDPQGAAADALLATLGLAFRHGVSPTSTSGDLNEQLTAAILHCLPEQAFHTTGPLKSFWLLRLSCATQDTQGMIDQLLDLHAIAPLAAKRW